VINNLVRRLEVSYILLPYVRPYGTICLLVLMAFWSMANHQVKSFYEHRKSPSTSTVVTPPTLRVYVRPRQRSIAPMKHDRIEVLFELWTEEKARITMTKTDVGIRTAALSSLRAFQASSKRAQLPIVKPRQLNSILCNERTVKSWQFLKVVSVAGNHEKFAHSGESRESVAHYVPPLKTRSLAPLRLQSSALQ